MNNKKIFNFIIFYLFSYFIFLGGVEAASLSMSKSASSVGVGKTVKITLKVSGGTSYTYSNFAISYDEERFSFVSSSDNCNGLNCLVEGNSSVTLTFKAKTEGSGTFSASGAFEDDSSGSLSASTTVNVGSSSADNDKNLSINNNLSALSIEGYTLTPEFNKDTLEYTLDVPSDVTSLNINATAEDKNAKIIGAGKVDVTEGVNTLNVEVTAESGAKKTYVIKVNVEEKNPLQVKIGNKKYTIVKNVENLTKPENYEATTIKISGEDIPAFYSEITKFNLVGLKDEKGNIALYIYNEKEKEYTLYEEVKTSGILFYPIDIDKGEEGYNFDDYQKYDIKIGNMKVKGLKLTEDSNYAIIYGMDTETGTEGYYVYDLKNKTLQLYNDEYVQKLNKEKNIYSIVILSSWAVIFFCLIIIVTLCSKNSKRKKKIKIILEKLSKSDEGLDTGKDDIIDEEKIVDEVIEEDDDDEEMYNILDD